MKIFLFIFWLTIFAGFSMTFAQNNKEFKLYLLPTIKAEQLSKLNLDKIKPVGQPFLTTDDIDSYLKDTHEIVIQYTGAKRLKNLKVPDSGLSFIVFVGDEPIYTGAFWNSFSSISFRGVAVDVSNLKGDFPQIKLDLDYPPLAPKNLGFDPRPDPRVFEVFQKAGRLYEQLWVWGKCKKARSSMKRRLSFYFTFEVISVVKAVYKEPEITFELYDMDAFEFFDQLDPERKTNQRTKSEICPNSEKEILLKFQRLISDRNPALDLIKFEVK